MISKFLCGSDKALQGRSCKTIGGLQSASSALPNSRVGCNGGHTQVCLSPMKKRVLMDLQEWGSIFSSAHRDLAMDIWIHLWMKVSHFWRDTSELFQKSSKSNLRNSIVHLWHGKGMISLLFTSHCKRNTNRKCCHARAVLLSLRAFPSSSFTQIPHFIETILLPLIKQDPWAKGTPYLHCGLNSSSSSRNFPSLSFFVLSRTRIRRN